MPQRSQLTAQAVAEQARREAATYRGDHPRPLIGYSTVLVVYTVVVASAAIIAAATGRRFPTRWPAKDLFLVTLGSHKLSRTLAKDAVTSPLRAPFAHYAGTGGPAEVMEGARRSGQVRHSLGELLTCPFCLDVWIVTLFVLGLTFIPGTTRVVAGAFTALTGADFLQLAYAKAQQSAEG